MADVADALVVTAWLVVLGHNLMLATRGILRPLGSGRWLLGLALVAAVVTAGAYLERASGGRMPMPPLVTAAGVAIALTGTALHVAARRTLGAAWSASTTSPSVLVEGGAYRIVRHPLYVGLALIGLGTILAHPSLPTIAGGIGLLVGLAGKIAREERALAQAFGPRWDEYSARVPRLVPRLRRSAS